MQARKVFESIKHLTPRSEEEISDSFKNMSDNELYYQWYRSNGWELQKIFIDELKKRKAVEQLKNIKQYYVIYDKKHLFLVLNESIKHLTPRSEEEIFKSLDDVEKFVYALKNDREDIIRDISKKIKNNHKDKNSLYHATYVKALAEVYLQNDIESFDYTSGFHVNQNNKIISEQKFLDFLDEHNITYEVIRKRYIMNDIKFAGRAKDLIHMTMNFLISSSNANYILEDLYITILT